MSFTHAIHEKVTVGGTSISKTTTLTGGAKVSLEETIADSTTDGAVVFALDVSACKSFYMVSDQDITIETNDGSSPDDTINLIAGIPYVWHEDKYESFLLTSDVETLYVTNSSGAEAKLQIEALTDPTP